MRVLLIAPVEAGSGETITALHIAQSLVARGHTVRFLASDFARRFLDGPFPEDVWSLGSEVEDNHALWLRALREFVPDVVLFADYPHLFFSTGVSPLASHPGWVESLERLDACLVTLDHFGFAQRAMGMFFGPAHLTTFHYERFPDIPVRMRILLPCPMHEPGPVEGRRGEPFRYWTVPIAVSPAVRADIRLRYLSGEDDLLVFHSVPNWAWRAAEALDLPFYQFLPRLLQEYFGGSSRPVTVVSVNNGHLLDQADAPTVRIVNLETLPTTEFEGLMFAADLVITENKVSIAMGKAICGLQPCAVLKNSYRMIDLVTWGPPKVRQLVLEMEAIRRGAVYPYEVFPSGFKSELEQLVLYRDNSLTKAFADLEIFAVDETRTMLLRLLADPEARAALRAHQLDYVGRLAGLGDGAQILEKMLEQHREGW